MKTQVITLTIALIFAISLVSAVVVDSVQTPTLKPGEQGNIVIGIENILSDDVQDVTLTLELSNLPFIPIGSSSDGFDELENGDDGKMSYKIKASNDITPGDYQIPYTLKYTVVGEDVEDTRTGSIGIKISANSELSFTIDTKNPIIGQEGTITFKITNKGFADAKFVSVKLVPQGFTLLSEADPYIGTIDSDDFETATFNVIFNKGKPTFSAIVDYKDFDNTEFTRTIDSPIIIYTPEKAIELGLMKESKINLYVGAIILVIILWFVYRFFKKRRKLKRSMRK